MNGTSVFTINKDDEKLLNRAKKETGISADHRPSAGTSYSESLLTIWCEDDDTGCALMGCFLELRGDDDIDLNGNRGVFTHRRLRVVL